MAACRRSANVFGPLEYAPMGLVSDAERAKLSNPHVATISNIVHDGKPIGGLANAEAAWHTDMSYIERPPTASILYAVEVPGQGGDTHLLQHDRRPGSIARRRWRPGRVPPVSKHDAAHDSIGKLRPGHHHAPNPLEAPGAVHPMARRHPENGTEALFLGRRQDAYVEGLSLTESEALLDEVWRHVALPDATWTQQWQVGDLIIWDNRSVMHRRAAFDPNARRLMRRTQIRQHTPGQVAQQQVAQKNTKHSPTRCKGARPDRRQVWRVCGLRYNLPRDDRRRVRTLSGDHASDPQARRLSWLERYLDMVEVVGSTPIAPTKFLTGWVWHKPRPYGPHVQRTGSVDGSSALIPRQPGAS